MIVCACGCGNSASICADTFGNGHFRVLVARERHACLRGCETTVVVESADLDKVLESRVCWCSDLAGNYVPYCPEHGINQHDLNVFRSLFGEWR